MLTREPPFLGHPTKVTFTFSEKCLKDDLSAYPSYWSGSPYQSSSTHNIQRWLALKMKSQREKLRIEQAVQRAERKLKVEYDKQKEAKRLEAEQKFKKWLKTKGFRDQAPLMLNRPIRVPGPPPSSPVPTTPTTRQRPRTAKVRKTEVVDSTTLGSQKPKIRPKSANSRPRRINSTLEETPPVSSKTLGQDDYMKMRHMAGKRYQRMKEQKSGYQCEDQLLRKLQDLQWEEDCIKKGVVTNQKVDIESVRAAALKRKKKKMKFKGERITVEVEELDSNAEVDIQFEEVDDQCSDIGCIEKEGVDFHIESRETIDLGHSVEDEDSPCRPMSTLPQSAPCRPNKKATDFVEPAITEAKTLVQDTQAATPEPPKSSATAKKEASPKATEPKKVAKSHEPAKKTKTPDPAKKVKSPEPAKNVKSPESVKAPEPAKNLKSPEPAKIVKSPEPTKNVKSAEPAKIVKSPDPVKNVKSPEPAKTVKSPEPTKVVKAPESDKVVGTPEPAKKAKSLEAAKEVKSSETIKKVEASEPIAQEVKSIPSAEAVGGKSSPVKTETPPLKKEPAQKNLQIKDNEHLANGHKKETDSKIASDDFFD